MIVENALIRSHEPGPIPANASSRPAVDAELHVLPGENAESAAPPDPVKIKEAVKEINEFIKQANPSIEFSVDEESGRTIVKMIDIENNQLIRQIPTKEALAISRALDSLKGMTVHLKA